MSASWDGAPWKPRAWQADALPQLVDTLRSGRAGLVSAVMGSGKSILIAEVVAAALPKAEARGTPIVVSAPSRKLVRQLGATIRQRLGMAKVGLYFTDAKECGRPVVVACNASVPALVGNLPGRCALWVADEAHQSQADGILEAHKALRPACRLGFTATPFRADAAESLELWDEVVYQYTLGDALRDEVLVPWRAVNWSGEGAPDVNAITLRLAKQHGDGPGIISARSIEDAEEYADYLSAADFSARAIHSQQGKAEQERLLERLRTGALRALVHVALLAEGVDLPWLRWLALRRRVSSRVRLFQEFGRVLRTCEGKSEAVVIDPYDLLGCIGLSHSSNLGSNDELAAKLGAPEPEEDEDDEFPLMDLPPITEPLPPAVAVSAVGAWARALLSCLEANGLYSRGEFDRQQAGWRTGKASEKQVETLSQAVRNASAMPRDHAQAVRQIIEHRDGLTRGVASDLLSVLITIGKQRSKDCGVRRAHHGYYPKGYRAWRWPEQPEVCLLPQRVQLALPMGMS